MSDQEKDIKAFLKVRREKLEQLREEGIEPFPHEFDFSHTATLIHAEFGDVEAEKLEAEPVDVRVCGRIVAQDDRAGLLTAVRELAEDGSVREDLGRRAAEAFCEEYSSRVVLETIRKAVEDMEP